VEDTEPVGRTSGLLERPRRANAGVVRFLGTRARRSLGDHQGEVVDHQNGFPQPEQRQKEGQTPSVQMSSHGGAVEPQTVQSPEGTADTLNRPRLRAWGR
jgi:hypothetical protein